ncbi:Uncharacterized protein Fot_14862 [Forsythia ovata]|uniref:Uncharacterized protein n=1 Tax=Forsythia ovata TaxID=205694 RepID=A0ABD1W7L4_9LAMI
MLGLADVPRMFGRIITRKRHHTQIVQLRELGQVRREWAIEVVERGLRVRRRVRLERVLDGRTPKMEAAGRRRTITRSFSHRTPCQLHVVVWTVFDEQIRENGDEESG